MRAAVITWYEYGVICDYITYLRNEAKEYIQEFWRMTISASLACQALITRFATAI
jgi:hypothetical protein